MQAASSVNWLVAYGIIISAASSGLGTLFNGARILHAIASDDVSFVLRPFAVLSGSGEPTRATASVYLSSQLLLMFGSVDALAPVIGAMCMLVSFLMEFACWFLSSEASFKPIFRMWSSRACICGAVYSILLLLFLDPLSALLSFAALLGLTLLMIVSEKSSDPPWAAKAQARLSSRFLRLNAVSKTFRDTLKTHRNSSLLARSCFYGHCSIFNWRLGDLTR